MSVPRFVVGDPRDAKRTNLFIFETLSLAVKLNRRAILIITRLAALWFLGSGFGWRSDLFPVKTGSEKMTTPDTKKRTISEKYKDANISIVLNADPNELDPSEVEIKVYEKIFIDLMQARKNENEESPNG